MKNYRQLYCDAWEQIAYADHTPAYAAAWGNYIKLVEELVAANYLFFEDHHPDPEDPDYPVDEEALAELAREIEVLHRVGYKGADEWDEDYQKLLSKLHTA